MKTDHLFTRIIAPLILNADLYVFGNLDYEFEVSIAKFKLVAQIW